MGATAVEMGMERKEAERRFSENPPLGSYMRGTTQRQELRMKVYKHGICAHRKDGLEKENMGWICTLVFVVSVRNHAEMIGKQWDLELGGHEDGHTSLVLPA